MVQVMTDGHGPVVEAESRHSIPEWLNLLNGAGWQAHSSLARDLFASNVREGLRDQIEGPENLEHIANTDIYLIHGFVFLCLRLFRVFLGRFCNGVVALSDELLKLVALGETLGVCWQVRRTGIRPWSRCAVI